mmetsp:Transcript_20315/g.31097  ORF Transcript_20315/g.31097 Transcript_20315/m.31097 type:complete len:562 (+) Transcript_20315:187-1872(+)|eukprot:CAMPEP_0196814982 /NCGR_PEP_ID=MMETSP1362-20130617/47167_1 /TAXON_ID=163516 /ORGANISM="Leptocylindrus danicus, Strain CCMP1856" /LENGTH=561 /DNA_ID=CAMNT_0042191793 /DNA_START=151 /DNA_END=1836 /DNA_ORIENTATION=-
MIRFDPSLHLAICFVFFIDVLSVAIANPRQLGGEAIDWDLTRGGNVNIHLNEDYKDGEMIIPYIITGVENAKVAAAVMNYWCNETVPEDEISITLSEQVVDGRTGSLAAHFNATLDFDFVKLQDTSVRYLWKNAENNTKGYTNFCVRLDSYNGNIDNDVTTGYGPDGEDSVVFHESRFGIVINLFQSFPPYDIAIDVAVSSLSEETEEVGVSLVFTFEGLDADLVNGNEEIKSAMEDELAQTISEEIGKEGLIVEITSVYFARRQMQAILETKERRLQSAVVEFSVFPPPEESPEEKVVTVGLLENVTQNENFADDFQNNMVTSEVEALSEAAADITGSTVTVEVVVVSKDPSLLVPPPFEFEMITCQCIVTSEAETCVEEDADPIVSSVIDICVSSVEPDIKIGGMIFLKATQGDMTVTYVENGAPTFLAETRQSPRGVQITTMRLLPTFFDSPDPIVMEGAVNIDLGTRRQLLMIHDNNNARKHVTTTTTRYDSSSRVVSTDRELQEGGGRSFSIVLYLDPNVGQMTSSTAGSRGDNGEYFHLILLCSYIAITLTFFCE